MMIAKLGKWLLCVGVLAGLTASAWGQGALAAQQSAQNKLLAQRAARMDGIRKLAERINGLLITSKTHVKDFVTESDQIQAAMATFINGMKETNVRYMEDGTCEVTLEVTLVTVIEELKSLHQHWYKGDKFKAVDFDEMTTTNEVTTIKETGMGAPRPSGEIAVKSGTGSYDSLDYLTGKAKAFWLARVEPQGRLGAVRAARVDGMRKLVERLFGTLINSQTVVKDFVTERDDINALTSALLRGAREVGVKYHDEELIVEVTMEVTWETVYETTKQFAETKYKGDTVKLKYFEDRMQTVERKMIQETGMGVPNAKFLKGAANVQLVEAVAQSLQKWPPVISETGNAAIDKNMENAAQAKLMAFRGAEMDARRKLAERLDGLMLSSHTSVKDFVTENDEIRSRMMTFQTGAYVVENSQKVMEDGSVQVTVEMDPSPMWDFVGAYVSEKHIELK